MSAQRVSVSYVLARLHRRVKIPLTGSMLAKGFCEADGMGGAEDTGGGSPRRGSGANVYWNAWCEIEVPFVREDIPRVADQIGGIFEGRRTFTPRSLVRSSTLVSKVRRGHLHCAATAPDEEPPLQRSIRSGSYSPQ